MGKTMAEKIFSLKSGREVRAGDYVMAKIDSAMVNDATAPLAVKGLYEVANAVWDRDRVIIVFDHFAPAHTDRASKNHISIRKFAKAQRISNLYDVGEGICHQLLPEKGHVAPGDLIVGADSHSCTYGALGAFGTGVGSTDMAAVFAEGELWFKVPETVRLLVDGLLPARVYAKDVILRLISLVGADGASYKAVEFHGEAVRQMDVSSRMTLCNMAIEMGGKAGLIPPNEAVRHYLRDRIQREYKVIEPDEDARYCASYNLIVNDLEPQVAMPHSVDKVAPIGEVEGVELDQVFIGSCANGRYGDLKVAAEILGGRKVAQGLRLLVTPASREQYLRAEREGLLRTFSEAGGMVGAPSCSACFGGHIGLLGPGEKALATTNRNFRGRQGSPEASIYLSSPATAAASALTGKIADPRRF